jgi:hypothetical protein
VFYFRRAAFSQHLQNKVGLDLAKAVDLRINLNIDGVLSHLNLTLTLHIGKLTVFFASSGVQSSQFERDQFHFHRAAFSQHLHSKVGLALAKSVALRINLNIDGAPIAFKSHTHPSHSETSRLLTSSLSLGVPVPRPTQCMRGV